jgi:hypothetical protein
MALEITSPMTVQNHQKKAGMTAKMVVRVVELVPTEPTTVVPMTELTTTMIRANMKAMIPESVQTRQTTIGMGCLTAKTPDVPAHLHAQRMAWALTGGMGTTMTQAA